MKYTIRVAAFFIQIGLLATSCQAPMINPSPAGTQSAASQPEYESPATKAIHNPTSTANSNTATPSATISPSMQVKDAELGGLVLEFIHPFRGEAQTVLENLVADFNKSNRWGFTVRVLGAGSAGFVYEQVKDAVDTTDLPGLAAAPLEVLSAWSSQPGLLVNLKEYADHPTRGLTNVDMGDIPRTFWLQNQVNGNQVGLPLLQNAQVIYSNTTWAEELGFKQPPTTPAEFREQACAAAAANLSDDNKGNDGTGGWIIDTDPLTLLSWFQVFGFQDVASLGNPKYTFSGKPALDAFEYLHGLEESGCAWLSRLPDPEYYFATRQALFYSAGLSHHSKLADAMAWNESEDGWTMIPFPSGKGKPIILSSGISLAILSGDSRQQMAAWLFALWIRQPENLSRLAKAAGMWPASTQAIQHMADYKADHPQWAESLLWIPIAQAAPNNSSWHVARSILSDAGWQLFQPVTQAGQSHEILRLLDDTLEEVLTKDYEK